MQIDLFTNKYGILFHKVPFPKSDEYHIANAYLCNLCGHTLYSKTGAKNHRCGVLFNQTLSNSFHIKNKAFIHFLLRYIATTNAPYRSIDNEFLRMAIGIINANITIPGRNKLTEEMINFSHYIRTEMLHEIKYKYVSILFDSCKRWGVNYQGVILYTPERLYLWSAVPTSNSKAKTLYDVTSYIVDVLAVNKTTVISICDDNCKANISAYKKLLKDSNEKHHFYRQPCCAHTLNLVISDLMEKDDDYGKLTAYIKTLMNFLPDDTYRKGFNPVLLRKRWSSMYECVAFIVKNIDAYNESDIEEVKKALAQIHKIIDLKNLEEILKILWNSIEIVERDFSSISEIYPLFLTTYYNLLNLNSPAALKCSKYLKDRFTTTLPLALPCLAFLLTPQGLNFYRNCEEQKVLFDFALIGMKGYLMEKNLFEKYFQICEDSFSKYLNNSDIEKMKNYPSHHQMWNSISFQKDNKHISSFFFDLAYQIVQIPSTECAVERMFSALSKVASTETCNVKPETLNARLIVKFDSIFAAAGAVSWEKLSRDTTKALKMHKYPKFLNKK